MTDTDTNNFDEVDMTLHGHVGWVLDEPDWLPQQMVERTRHEEAKAKAEQEAKQADRKDTLAFLRTRGVKVRTPAEVTADVLDRADKQSRREDYAQWKANGGTPTEPAPTPLEKAEQQAEEKAAETKAKGLALVKKLLAKRRPQRTPSSEAYSDYRATMKAKGQRPVEFNEYQAGRR
jgi:hypothetical protein